MYVIQSLLFRGDGIPCVIGRERDTSRDSWTGKPFVTPIENVEVLDMLIELSVPMILQSDS
jgi:hypothetical protein